MADRNRFKIEKQGARYALLVVVHNYPETEVGTTCVVSTGYKTYSAAEYAAKQLDTYVAHSAFEAGLVEGAKRAR